jgi:eukaryotic-like serine/threonine-protein kinase
VNRPATEHPTSEQLRLFGIGQLESAEQVWVEKHIAECEPCCESLQVLPDDTLLANLKNCETSIAPTMDSEHVAQKKATSLESGIPPELVDHPRYRVAEELGKGGMGVVYKAEHRLMERPVALKVINHRLVRNKTAIERFRLEVRAAAKLSHANIVTAHDAEQAGNIHFLVMEFVEGTDLAKQVRKSGPLPVRHACHFVRQVAMGLQHASEKGMVHRDIKPQNLMLTREGRVKILDFGLARLASEADVDSEAAKLTKDGVMLGTPDYIAPEQILDSRKADIRADIYSLGCTLYYLLTGHAPFPDGSAIDKMTAHLKRMPPDVAKERDDLPDGLSPILWRMLEKQVENRFQTPQEVAVALQPYCKSDDSSSQVALVAPPVAPEPAFDPLAVALPAAPLIPAGNYAPKQTTTRRANLRKYRGLLIAAGVAILLGLVLIVANGPIRRSFTASNDIPLSNTSSSNDDSIAMPAANQGPRTSQGDSRSVPSAVRAAAPSGRPRVVIVVPRDELYYPDYGQVVRAFGDRAELVVASSRTGRIVASNGTQLTATMTLEQLDPTQFAAIIFTGANDPQQNLEFLRRDDYWNATHVAIEAMSRSGKLVTSLCVGNAILADHGVLNGKRAAWTSYMPDSYRSATGVAWQESHGVFAEGHIITATSYEEADAFADAVLAALAK